MTKATGDEGLREAAKAFEAAATADIPVGNGYAEWVAKAQQARADLLAALTQGESRQTGWIDWPGDENVAPEGSGEVRFADGSVEKFGPGIRWGWRRWSEKEKHPRDIIAYRLLPAAPTPAGGNGPT